LSDIAHTYSRLPDGKSSLFWLAMAGSLVILFIHSWQVREYQLDDALIYLRYIRNFIEGNGLVYNKGEHFNGLTSPLYTYLMLLVGQLFSSLQISSVVFSTTCMASALVILGLYFREQQHSWTMALTGMFCVATPYFYSTYGMETPLFMLLVAVSLYLYQKEHYFALGIVAALLLLTRAEGIFLLIALLFEHVLTKRKLPTWRILPLPALILVAHYTFNKYYFGEFLPQTGWAKIWQGQSGLWGDKHPLFLHAAYLHYWFFGGKWWLLLGMISTASVGAFAQARKNRPIIVFLFLYLLFFCLLDIPNYNWYYAPFFLFLPYFSGIGLLATWRRLVERNAAVSKSVAVPVLGSLIAATLLFILIAMPPVTSMSPNGGKYSDSYKGIGRWLQMNTAPTDKIAMVEIGTVGYYSDRYIIDILGLVNPYNAELIGKRDFDKWLEYYQPDYFLVHQPFWNKEISVEHLVGKGEMYVRADFNFPGYALLCRKSSANCVGPITLKPPKNKPS